MLRDTGCSGIVVKKELVSKEQYTGDFNCMLLINNTVRKVPIARITIDTPYLSRSQAKKEGKHKPLKVASSPKCAIVDRNKLVRLQREDKSLEKDWHQRDIKVKGKKKVASKKGAVYCTGATSILM